MNQYLCYRTGRPGKKRVIQALTAFDARRQLAEGLRCNFHEIIATRFSPPKALRPRKEVVEAFRDAVLAALDQTALEQFGELEAFQYFAKSGAGSWDQDLPALFKAIDRQAEVLADRYYVVLVEPAKEPA